MQRNDVKFKKNGPETTRLGGERMQMQRAKTKLIETNMHTNMNPLSKPNVISYTSPQLPTYFGEIKATILHKRSIHHPCF